MSDRKTNTESGKRRGGRTNYGPWLRLFKRLLVVAVVLIIGFLVWDNWEKIAPEALLDWTDQKFGNAQSGEGYPCAVNGNDVIDMTEVNQHLVVLSDTGLRFFNGSAACVADRTHAFTQPVMRTAGNYVLLAEMGGSRIRLDTRREIVLEHELANRRIYAANLLSNGTTAVVLNSASQSYVSEIVVLNTKGDTQFSYKSNKYLLTDVALSPNGKQVTAVGTAAENGVLKSVLLVITLSSNKVEEYTGVDVLLHNVAFFSNGTAIAVGDKEVWTLKGNASEVEKTVYGGFEPVGYTATSSLVGVALRRSGSTNTGEIWAFDANGKRVQAVPYEGTYRSLSGKGSTLLLLTDRALYETRGSDLQSTLAVPSDCLQAVTYRGSSMLLTLGELKRPEK